MHSAQSVSGGLLRNGYLNFHRKSGKSSSGFFREKVSENETESEKVSEKNGNN